MAPKPPINELEKLEPTTCSRCCLPRASPSDLACSNALPVRLTTFHPQHSDGAEAVEAADGLRHDLSIQQTRRRKGGRGLGSQASPSRRRVLAVYANDATRCVARTNLTERPRNPRRPGRGFLTHGEPASRAPACPSSREPPQERQARSVAKAPQATARPQTARPQNRDHRRAKPPTGHLRHPVAPPNDKAARRRLEKRARWFSGTCYRSTRLNGSSRERQNRRPPGRHAASPS